MYVGNLLLAGRWFFRFGSAAKWLTNLGIFASSAVCLVFFPFSLSSAYGNGGAEVFGGTVDIVADAFAGGDSPVSVFGLVFMIALFVLTLKYVFTLPFLVGKTASRFANTFKFDGYKDKGFLFRSIVLLVGAVVFVVFAIMYFSDRSGSSVRAVLRVLRRHGGYVRVLAAQPFRAQQGSALIRGA